MERYKNLGGDSGVLAYEIGDDSITVQFSTGRVYLYTHRSTSSANIEQMKLLAVAGKGLNSYISKYVKKGYESKLR
ncbi:MAG: hypothetical protein NT010_13380 [Proteobacteria bacterium]|nr:hypothetical protein [Pseudomonadota bacterium]